MKHFATPTFWKCYYKLPDEVQQLSDKNYELLKQNPNHPSLNLKHVGRYWSVKAGRKYRAIGIDANPDIVWFWIGSHTEYDKMLK
ncbi:MAG: hypothetical protein HW421_4070 [Ignavibacteria bacterium]|nr:hypothetical protein [Ignavibacteria bacterium]